jgi:aspartyl protease
VPVPTPFRSIAHLVVVPVRVNGVDASFVIDSGIGLTLLSQATADRAGVTPNGSTFTGQRMSGQEVTTPLASVASLAFDELELRDHEAGVFDLDGLPDGIDGFLSLAYFAASPFTVDYARHEVRLGSEEGTVVGLEVERDGPAVTAFAPLTLPDGSAVRVEVDMGSDCLILDDAFAQGELRAVEGTDETGHDYVRRFGELPGRISLSPQLWQDDPKVMYQDIHYDGLIGDDFLRRYTVTFDIPGSRMVFSR